MAGKKLLQERDKKLFFTDVLPQLISGNIGLEKGETGRGRSAHLASCDLPRVR